jgi:glycosyltransferase involved in cell wall biosynthesis
LIAAGKFMPIQVSLVIPVRNEEESLAALVESICAQTRLPNEVILVDGGSIDRTVELARKLTSGDEQFRVIEAGDATPGRGRNVGIAAASHEWIALTDAGIRLEPTWLERLVEVAERDAAVDVVYGNYEPVTESFFTRCAALVYCPAKVERGNGRSRGPSTASMMLRREVWREVGGIPDLRASEDLIFFERIAERGFQVGWAPQATVWWQLQPSLARTYRKFALYSKHNIWAGRQRYWHYGVLRFYLLVIPFIALAVLHSAWWLVAPLVGFLSRVAKSIWARREGRGWGVVWNPIQFAGVTGILATIDLATLVGWAQAKLQPKPMPANGESASDSSGAVLDCQPACGVSSSR